MKLKKSYGAIWNAHLSKPISKADLIQAIENYFSVIQVVIDDDLKSLIPEYLSKRRKEIEELEKALERNDFQSIQSLGHKLRGSAGSYGFFALTEIGKELEENAKVLHKLNIEKAVRNYQLYLQKLKVTYSKA